MGEYKFTTLTVSSPREWVLLVQININRLNMLNTMFFEDLLECFGRIGRDTNIRCVVLSALPDAKVFTAGLDLKSVEDFPKPNGDAARQGLKFIDKVSVYQSAISSIEKCNKPVIAGKLMIEFIDISRFWCLYWWRR